MIHRKITKNILRDLEWSPVVGIVGSRQVGKTTLAKHIQTLLSKETLYLDLELESDRYKLQDAEHYLNGHAEKCIIIDEIQEQPELFPLLRALVDQNRVAARFIVLGSAAPHIVKKNTETLAGRISYHELSPFLLSEVKDRVTMGKHWFNGGFPNALLAPQEIMTRKWLQDFRDTFIYRDLNKLGYALSATTLQNLLSMLAHLHGSNLNQAKIARSLGVSNPTVQRYLELLEGSFLIRTLPPYFANIGKRLIKAPKIYFRDSGLLHFILKIFDLESLKGHPNLGESWEGYVIEQIIREAPEFSDFYFYRTQKGAELDLVMITPTGKMACFEIKYNISPKISRGFYSSIEDLKPQYKYVITPAGERIEWENGVIICPLEAFLHTELETML